ncbi:hypothetical protein [Streptomyces albus]|uniref:hypothetical protein n=1 Tax=Streptomyces sp. NRRL F-5917 TaxID=1463873 RepID=UPI0004BE808A|nr:hypothetical protein [Streptomyces sp. NRRL F-5917]
MPPTEPVYSPAGRDDELRQVCDDVRLGRWWRMAELLDNTLGVQQRVERTRVLAEVGEGCVYAAWAWAREAPCPDAEVMKARAAVYRARLLKRRNGAAAGAAAREAEALCWRALSMLRADAVPYVCLLALAPVAPPGGFLAVNLMSDPPPDPFLPAGPWRLLFWAKWTEPCLREAYQRMLELLTARQSWAARDFCLWAAERDAAHHGRSEEPHGGSERDAAPHDRSEGPHGCALQTLPLHQRALAYYKARQDAPGSAMPHRAWRSLDIKPAVQQDVDRALAWFEGLRPGEGRLEDLHVLAHALWASTRYQEAKGVFREIGHRYVPVPWAFAADVPGDTHGGLKVFSRAREECLSQKT